MDQARIAGLGNLLIDEALWRAAIDPARIAAAVDADERRVLHRAIRTTLRVLDRRGGSHTGDMPRELDEPCPRDGGALLRRTDRRSHHLLLFRAPDLSRGAANVRLVSRETPRGGAP